MTSPLKVASALAVFSVVLIVALSPPPSPRPVTFTGAATGMGWTNVTKPVAPPGVAGGMMAYDPPADRFVAFGGSNGDATNGTWVFDPATATWTQLHPALAPPARGDGALIFDDQLGAFVLFGGWKEPADEVYVRLGDTWLFFLGSDTWVRVPAPHAPEPRSDSAIAYDPQDDFLLLFGGFNGSAYLGDAWRYRSDAGDWVSMQASIQPSKRADGRMVYDPSNHAFYMFGGNDYSGPNFSFHHLDDTWRFDPVGEMWTELQPIHTPQALDYAVFATDTAAGELLSFGGFGNRSVLSDFWAFDTTTLDWRNLTSPGGPPARMAAVGGYSPIENLFVVFSGGNKTATLTDTWVYRYPGSLAGTITVTPANPQAGDDVQFQGRVVGGTGVFRTMRWDFGDGTNGTGNRTTHRFVSAGLYSVRLHTSDDAGDVLNVTAQVSVGGWAPLPLVTGIVVGVAGVLAVAVFWRRRRRLPPPPPTFTR